jgi:hypothetical protein
MKKSLLSLMFSILFSGYCFAQATGVAINESHSSANASAMLDVSSTTKGMLAPRMTTTQRDAISSPASGLLIYNTTTGQFNYYSGSAWTTAVGPTGATGPSGTTGQDAASVFGTGFLTSFTSTTFSVIPGLTYTVNVPSTSVIQISTNGGFYTNSTASSGVTSLDVAIYIDGAAPSNGSWQRFVAANTAGIANMIQNFTMSKTVTLSAGNHTIDVRAKYISSGSTASATVGGDNTSTLQGTLNVITLKK